MLNKQARLVHKIKQIYALYDYESLVRGTQEPNPLLNISSIKQTKAFIEPNDSNYGN